tara:strand:- start:632 stop:1072 length:441 start_codon:yes stop_codon:yes gene_type:complete
MSGEINQTLLSFGYPRTLLKEYPHWCVLVRQQHVTLGSLVLVSKSFETNFSDLPSEAFEELHEVIKDIETNLKAHFDYEKVNYLMLMMVDPHVHYHVIPRYSNSRELFGKQHLDGGWPGLPDLSNYVELSEEEIRKLVTILGKSWL